jgi:hypothetical protein
LKVSKLIWTLSNPWQMFSLDISFPNLPSGSFIFLSFPQILPSTTYRLKSFFSSVMCAHEPYNYQEGKLIPDLSCLTIQCLNALSTYFNISLRSLYTFIWNILENGSYSTSKKGFTLARNPQCGGTKEKQNSLRTFHNLFNNVLS